jgi:septum formation protein
MKKINSQVVILASRSPRRVELLKQIGIDSIVRPADIDETVLEGEAPSDYVQRLAKEKVIAIAKSLKSEYENIPVLAADTTVAINGQILGKPVNDADAVEMLKKLSGSKHTVYTAVAMYVKNKVKVTLSETQVDMILLTDSMIKSYVATGEQRDKAGSYAIQGKAAAWVARIEGSYSGVMGLPLFETALLLKDISK